jgi:hypothetical protein
MAAIEFQGWPKIPRLNRDMVITEKIDGTNAAVRIVPMEKMDHIGGGGEGALPILFDPDAKNALAIMDDWVVFAQSRKRLITTEYDNHGFAGWVQHHAMELALRLGEGVHFGEWWGSGIQRGYGLTKGEKRFSLFNVNRYMDISVPDIGLGVVPVLYEGPFDTHIVKDWGVLGLAAFGSQAAPGFLNPEGVVVYHEAACHGFKVTIKDDEKPKGQVA